MARDLVRLAGPLLADIQHAMQGRSTADVARDAGLSRQYVHNVLSRNQATADRDKLRALLAALGLELDHYAGPAEQPQPWTLPAPFDQVPAADRAEAERILAWMLGLRRRRA